MLSRIKFPVVVELIPCSVAQGIHLRTSRKYLNSHPFSMRIFAEKRRIPENSLFFPCMRCRSGPAEREIPHGNSDVPPSTRSTCPLMNFARGPARNATASAISSGSA